MAKYEHTFDICFTVISRNKNSDNISPRKVLEALKERVRLVEECLKKGESTGIGVCDVEKVE